VLLANLRDSPFFLDYPVLEQGRSGSLKFGTVPFLALRQAAAIPDSVLPKAQPGSADIPVGSHHQQASGDAGARATRSSSLDGGANPTQPDLEQVETSAQLHTLEGVVESSASGTSLMMSTWMAEARREGLDGPQLVIGERETA
jgi:hypothetical protein